MLMDSKLLFSDDQSLALGTGDTASTNIIDLSGAQAKSALGNALTYTSPSRNQRLMFGFLVTSPVTSGGSATLAVSLQTSSDGSTWTTLQTTGAQNYATYDKGYTINWYVPDSAKRYLRVLFSVATAATTGGVCTAGLFMEPINAAHNT